MLDLNMIIANNIQAELKKENKKQVDLAEGIGVSKQTMSKIMNGARAINYMKLYNYLKERLCADKMTYIFLDEVQEVPSFEKVVDSLYIRDYVDVYGW